ncbi:3-deoxy-manno-octulosonate cytidylyltransferase [Marinomonas atlantica]|uniref:3-deoxy-manno-octulosonate cytidylyltransferase n=1 Tax=Marinomonas atlantica TaxID=1806668 RepID=UPI00082D19EB|nr:3-deoxy-manno-octulosonate cytidylyltransferase [Marinomonas atlantica]
MNLPPFHIVVPARYASQRFPQKMLADLAGKPVVQWVYELALKAGAESVTIATDHESIFAAAKAFGADAVMTRDDHENGTERLAEVAMLKGWSGDEIVVNVQGDEPLLPIALIQDAVRALAEDDESEMATVACPIHRPEDIFNPSVVKVVCDAKGRALYFSRATMPWDRDGFAQEPNVISDGYPALRHVGLYVYRVSLLDRYAHMPMSPLEKWEKLEQLRFLHQGIKVQVAVTQELPPHGVDTPEDLQALTQKLSSQ